MLFTRKHDIDDPVFGLVSYRRKGLQKYWTSTVVFAPTQSEVTLYFSELEGIVPLEIKEFYFQIEDRYESLSPSIEETLYSSYCREIERVRREDINSIFRIDSIELPSSGELRANKVSWVIDYTYDLTDPGKTFNVDFTNWEIVECFSGERSQ